MPILYTNELGKNVVAHLAVGVSAEQAAKAMKLSDGWREITNAEAEELQKPTFEEARQTKLVELMEAYDMAFVEIEKSYPQAEREGWTIQEAEAKAVLADPQVETPVLSVLIAQRGLGETVADFAQKVLDNSAQWRFVYAFYTGQQQKMYAEIVALQTVEEIQAYEIVFQAPYEQ